MRHKIFLLMFWIVLCWVSIQDAYAKWVWNKESGWVDPLTLNPGIPDQRYKLALAMAMDRKYDSAVKEFQALLKRYPNSDLVEPCMFNIGHAYFLAGKHKKAFNAYERLLERFPGTRLTELVMEKEFQAGVALMELKPLSSVDIFEKIIEHNPMGPLAPDCQVKMGDAYFQAQEYEDAADAYRKLLETYPKSEWAPYAQYRIPLSRLNVELRRERDIGKLQKAREGFEEYIANYPEGPLTQEAKKNIHEVEELMAQREYQTAEFYLRKKNLQAAIVYLQGIRDRFPNTSWAEKSQETIDFLKKISVAKK